VAVTAEKFEKDDDSNFHMDFIAVGALLKSKSTAPSP
jgi:hypothetical protein